VTSLFCVPKLAAYAVQATHVAVTCQTKSCTLYSHSLIETNDMGAMLPLVVAFVEVKSFPSLNGALNPVEYAKTAHVAFQHSDRMEFATIPVYSTQCQADADSTMTAMTALCLLTWVTKRITLV